jgi:hypothetical protein
MLCCTQVAEAFRQAASFICFTALLYSVLLAWQCWVQVLATVFAAPLQCFSLGTGPKNKLHT